MDVEQLNKSTDWGSYVDEILDMKREGWELKRISAKMENKYGLKKSERQYKGLFSKHRVRKNQTATTWATVGRRIGARQGKRSEVFLAGVRIPEAKWEKETKRYAHDNHSSSETSSGENIIVQTPPTVQDPAEDAEVEIVHREDDEPLVDEQFGTPGDLVVFNPEQYEEISLPEELLDEEDHADLEVLTKKIRQLRMSGLKMIQDTDENEAMFSVMEDEESMTTTMFGEKRLLDTIRSTSQHVQRPLSCNWTWESLAGILEDFVTSPDIMMTRSRLYGHPTDMTALRGCSKTDLLNLLVAMVLRSEERSLRLWLQPWLRRLCMWLSHPRHLKFLALLLSPHRGPLSEAFANGLSKILASGEKSTSHRVHHIGAMKTLFEVFQSGAQRPSPAIIKRLFIWAIELKIPDCIPALVNMSADFLTEPHRSYLPRLIVHLPLQVVAMLLSHGIDVEKVLMATIEKFTEASGMDYNSTKHYQLVLMCLSKGVDVDRINKQTMPLSIAEYGALRTPMLGKLFKNWTTDSVSLEVIAIFSSLCSSAPLQDFSLVSKELALFGLIQRGKPDLGKVRALLDHGAHPDLPTIFQEGHHERAIGRNEPESYGAFVSGTTADRLHFGFRHEVERPVDICCAEWDQEATLLLMDFGSSPPKQLLQAFPANIHPTTSFQFQFASWIYNLIYHQKSVAVEYMRAISYYFSYSDRDIASTSDCFLQWAIIDEDATLVRRLATRGVDLHRPRLFFYKTDYPGRVTYCTPFLKALQVRSLSFAKVIWDIWPYFLDVETSNLGAYELVGFCRVAFSWRKCKASSMDSLLKSQVDEDYIDKIGFLLDMGARVNAPLRRNNNALVTPIQAALQMRYDTRLSSPHKRHRRSLEICGYLIQRGANVDARESDTLTPLQLAALQADEEMIRILLRNGANPNLTRYQHSDGDSESIISSPLETICGLPKCLCFVSVQHRYPIRFLKHEPFRSVNKFEMARLLLQAGADINGSPNSGSTALVEACYSGCLPTMKLLLEYGADVNQRSADGRAPIETAIQSYTLGLCQTDMVFTLLGSGAHVTEQGTLDLALWESLLSQDWNRFKDRMAYIRRSEQLCAYWGPATTVNVEEILEAGADVNYVKPDEGYRNCSTPLTAAVVREDLQGVMCLLDYGADVAFDGQKALEIAIKHGNYEIAQVLYNVGARPLWEEKSFRKAIKSARIFDKSTLPLVQSWKKGNATTWASEKCQIVGNEL